MKNSNLTVVVKEQFDNLICGLFLVIGRPVFAQVLWPGGAVSREILVNGVPRVARIPGNHMWYNITDSCGAHKTKTSGNKIDHIHVDASFPATGLIEGTNIPVTVTVANVRAYWDQWFLDEITSGRRANASIRARNGDTEDLTVNCFGYSLGYDTWIQDATPIYDDDYTKLANQNFPSAGDVISIYGHVISVSSLNYTESSNTVVQTRERNRHSAVYYISYDWFLGCNLKNYHRKK